MCSRYVREILGALAVGEVINVDDSSTKFHVPEYDKQAFVVASVFARFIPQCGMGYGESIFSILEDMLVLVKKDMIDTDILPVIPQIVPMLESGMKVGEFGCATGVLLNKLASRFKNSIFIGSDVASKLLEEARAVATSQNLENVTYSIDNIENLSEKYNESFDWILTRFLIHDLTYPQQALNQIYRCLKPGGIFSMIEVGLEGEIADNISNGTSMFFYSISTFMCIPETFRHPDSAALGATWGAPLAREMVAKAGFTIINESASRFNEKEIHFVCLK